MRERKGGLIAAKGALWATTREWWVFKTPLFRHRRKTISPCFHPRETHRLAGTPEGRKLRLAQVIDLKFYTFCKGGKPPLSERG